MPLYNSKKYHENDSDSSDHYYQNQNKLNKQQPRPNGNQLKNKLPNFMESNEDNKNMYINGFQGFMPPAPPVPLLTPGIYSSSAITSSTSSSERALILANNKRIKNTVRSTQPNNNFYYRLNLPYCLLVFVIIFLALSLLSIAVTFIFPFWIRLSVQNSSALQTSVVGNATLIEQSGFLNVTNQNNHLCLLTRNFSNTNEPVPTAITFDLGLWEVKMQQELEFYDLSSRSLVSQNLYPQSMLWLDGDVNNFYQSFLMRLLQFVDLRASHLFLVQILEILHLIFAFLTVAFTSYTLCLCGNQPSSICWYTACFLLCACSFGTGLAVLVLLVLWPAGSRLALQSQFSESYAVVKTFSWGFWYAVGINGTMLLVCALMLIYLLISSAAIYRRKANLKQQHRLAARQHAAAKNNLFIPGHNENIINGFRFRAEGIDIEDDDFRPANMNIKASKIYQNQQTESGLDSDQINMEFMLGKSKMVPTSNGSLLNQTSMHAPSISNSILPSVQMTPYMNQEANSNNQMTSPSYIFYTGHGNFRKQSIGLDGEPPRLLQDELLSFEQQQPPPPNDFTQQNSLISYAMLMQNNNNQGNGGFDHQYSNLPPAHNNNDFKLTTYR